MNPYSPPKDGKWHKLPTDYNEPPMGCDMWRKWDDAKNRYQDQIEPWEITKLTSRHAPINPYGESKPPQ